MTKRFQPLSFLTHSLASRVDGHTNARACKFRMAATDSESCTVQPPSSIALQRLSSSLDGFKSLTPSYRRKISEQARTIRSQLIMIAAKRSSDADGRGDGDGDGAGDTGAGFTSPANGWLVGWLVGWLLLLLLLLLSSSACCLTACIDDCTYNS